MSRVLHACMVGLVGSAIASSACRQAAGSGGSASPTASATAIAHAAASAGTPASTETDGQWIRPAGDYASTRYSALTEITAGRVRELAVKASIPTGNAKGHEAAPLVIGDTMYVVTPYPNDLLAFDLTQPGAVK